MVLSVFDDWYNVPFDKNSQKQSKDSQNSKNHHWCTNRHMSTQSPPNTQSLANAATSRDLHHMCLGSGHSPSPVGRADSMCLHGRPCVWLPFAVTRCPSVCHTPVLSLNGYTYLQSYSPSGSPTILVFTYQTGWQYSDGNPPNGGAECKGVWKNHDFRSISGFIWQMMQDTAIVTMEGK